MTLIQALKITGWAAGFNTAFTEVGINDRVFFAEKKPKPAGQTRIDKPEVDYILLPDFFRLNHQQAEELSNRDSTVAMLIDFDEIKTSYGHNMLLLASESTPADLPPISAVYGCPMYLKASDVVLLRIFDSDIMHKGHYLHAEKQWVVGFDFTFRGKVIEWWPIPKAGTGTKVLG